MTRILTALTAVLTLAACRAQTVTLNDLVEVAYAPIVTDPATELDRYLLPGDLPAGHDIPLPAGADVIGTYATEGGGIDVYARTALPPAQVLTFYQDAHAGLLLTHEDEHRITLCGGGEQIAVSIEEGVLNYSRRAFDATCRALPDPDQPPAPAQENRRFEQLLPDEAGIWGATATYQDGSASRVSQIAVSGSLDPFVGTYRQRFEASGWQFVDARITANSAWVVWQQPVEGEGLMRLQMTLTRQTETTAIVGFLITPAHDVAE